MKTIRDTSGKSIVAIVIVFLLLLGVGAGGFTFIKSARRSAAKGAPEKNIETSMWRLEEFVVNLADSSESRYLKVNVVLEVEGKVSENGEGGPSPEEVRARDTIISVITKKHYMELQSVDGKAKLKSELKKTLNLVLQDAKVVNIYFTSFAMQ